MALTDTEKTRQQLIDELSSLRLELDELRPINEAVNRAADAIISVDTSQCIIRFNQGAELVFGYQAEEVMGEPLEILLPPHFRPAHEGYVEKYARELSGSRRMNERSEIVGQKKDGSIFPARASISRVERNNNVVLTVFLRDVSEIKNAELEIRRIQDELAHVSRVGMLGEISASLAHELNQPLTAVLTNAQVLRRNIEAMPAASEEVKETLSDVIDDTKRAAEVIKRLRSLSKPQRLLKESIDLAQVITEVENLLHSEFVMRQADLQLQLAADMPAVFGDHIQLQQILLNLLGNALDAMEQIDEADRHLLIRTRLARKGFVEVCIKDTGVGLEEEQHEKIFEPFYTTKSRGMGMGLAISRTMLHAHGGKMWAENNRDVGAAFYFTIPVANEAEAVRTTRHENLPGKDLPDRTSVFVVDDDPSIRQAMERLISSAGYAVETFASAQAFLQRETDDEGGCLLVDLHMPGETGLDLQTTLNNQDYSTPVIFITGGGNTAAGVRAMKQGAVDFLSKPVNEEELLNAIARAVEVDERVRARIARHAAAKEKLARLTAREAEVMSLVVKGLLNKQVADALGISEKTVKVHRGHVMQKVEARSVTDLVRLSEITAEDS